jgi:two-component system chemotaxis sensor kinase CheA
MMEPVDNDSAMDEVLQSLIAGFRDEARELLCDMESALMQLEKRPDDGELIARAFRALHTIKGNSSMFGLTALERFAHDLEHVFDQLRKGKMRVSSEIIDLTLGAKDRLLALLEADGDTAEERRLRDADYARIARLTGGEAQQTQAPPPPEKAKASLEEVFTEEALDLLRDLEVVLLALESAPDDAALLDRAARSLHTLRGNASQFGRMELEAFAQEVESVFRDLKSRAVPVTHAVIEQTLIARDRIMQQLLGSGAVEQARAAAEPQATQHVVLESSGQAATRVWKIVFTPTRQLFAGGTDPLQVFEELRSMGACSVTALLGGVPTLEEIDPGVCYLAWEIVLTTDRSLQELRDAFIFVGGDAVVYFTPDPTLSPEAATDVRGAQDAGVTRAAAPEAIAPVIPPQAAVQASVAEAALQRSGETTTTMRVAAAKLDKLVDLVGELVTVQARLSLLASQRTDGELLGVAEEVERLAAELRDHSLSVRMVPIGPAFGKFRRLVRDLSHEIGRKVDMVTEGEDTELDKNVIDRLNDPIVHLLRNSIDHGIEPLEERTRSGKPARGTVRLSAAYAGANVVISVEDDGAGIDAAAVRLRAVQRGLIAEGDQLSERELFALMFLPGFSTSEKVTKISGRGVGLDVVKRAVENLRGRVNVRSRAGAGTTFEIRIPLTLAIIEGLEVVLGDDHRSCRSPPSRSASSWCAGPATTAGSRAWRKSAGSWCPTCGCATGSGSRARRRRASRS